jgi:DNA-binding transcriptional MerR regulator
MCALHQGSSFTSLFIEYVTQLCVTIKLVTTWTIDELARLAGTTGRQVRALQTQGLLARPALVGRTGYYDLEQLDRLHTILRLQREGFSLGGIAVLFRALDAGMTLEQVVGLRSRADADGGDDDEDFSGWPDSPKGQLLSAVPTTLLDLSEAS